MRFAFDKLKHLFPLTVDKYSNITKEEISFLDQLIFRFSKMQDTMGRRLFPSLLNYLGEDITGKPFIDNLNSLEKLGLLKTDDWLILRETRNTVTHEYPFVTEDLIEGLNQLQEHSMQLIKIFETCKEYAVQRMNNQ